MTNEVEFLFISLFPIPFLLWCSNLLSIFLVDIFLLSSENSSYTLDTGPSIDIHFVIILPYSMACLFSTFQRVEMFNFDQVQSITFLFYSLCFWLPKTSSPNSKVLRLPLRFFCFFFFLKWYSLKFYIEVYSTEVSFCLRCEVWVDIHLFAYVSVVPTVIEKNHFYIELPWKLLKINMCLSLSVDCLICFMHLYVCPFSLPHCHECCGP